ADKARAILEGKGRSVRLVNMRSLAPIDELAVLEAARKTRLVVTIEDHFQVGGLYSIVCELLVRSGTSARVHPIALEQRWFRPGRLDAVLAHEGFTGEAIAKRIKAALERARA